MTPNKLPAPKALAAALALLAGTLGSAHAAVTITINNINAAGVGFNDTSAAVPIGGNTGTTVGQQRLQAFTYAANIWGSTLTSAVPIVINAQFSALTCTATSAVLGSAGATSVFRDFTNAPKAGTWYSYALANKISGAYLGTANAAQINANFNANLGQPACLANTYFYLGLDNNHGSNVDFVTVLLHEMGHGIGFQTFTNGSTGAFNSSLPSVWDHYLLDNTTNVLWKDMSATQRKASSLKPNGLSWTGARVTAAVPAVLSHTSQLLISGAPAGAAAGTYVVGDASFGPPLASPALLGQLMPVVDQADGSGLACTALSAANATAVKNNIALISRGTCAYTIKVKNAQNAGAIGVLIADNVTAVVSGLSGDDATITIPAVRISLADATTLKATLARRSRTSSGVVASMGQSATLRAGADSIGRITMYTPNPYESGSSVSHFTTAATRNQLMEPAINGDLTHAPVLPYDLTFELLKDIGW